VLELSSQGHSQRDIADTLHVNKSIISRDMAYLKQQANENLKTHIQVKLPEEYQNYMTGINQVLKICWEIVNKSRNVDSNNGIGQTMTVIDNKTVLQALALINDCNKYKMDLTTNGVVITDAIKFVQTNKEQLSKSTKEENKESKEPDYGEVRAARRRTTRGNRRTGNNNKSGFLNYSYILKYSSYVDHCQ
jgi:predicted transcriptional regulator